MIGKSLLHYEITAKLGEGGMGAVYLATDTKLGREVAIKILPDHFAKDPERLARFHREARTLAALNHPNIAGIHGLESDQGLNFLVMECAAGEDLSELIARGPVPSEEALTICRDIASGMEEAHQNGIIHRDLKPANVKISADGRAKILDFGLARAFQGESTAEEETLNSPTITAAMTGAGVILGTAAYMSPEQARGMAVDRRSDIWSFGAVVYEIFTGIRLFSGETISDTLAGILKTDPDWDALPEDTPDTVRIMLARCLNRDRQQRLQDIGEARILLSGDGISSLYSSLSQSAVDDAVAMPAQKSGRAAMIGAIVALVIGLGAGGFLANSFRPKEAPPSARHFDVTTSEEVIDAAAFPGISPDGTRAFYVINGDLWVRRFDTGANVKLPGPSDVDSPFWSPDSKSIGYITSTGMMRVSAEGGQPLKICDALARDVNNGAVWLTNDKILFASDKHLGIRAVSAGGGVPSAFVVPDSVTIQDVHEVAVIDEGRSLLYVAHLVEGSYGQIFHFRDGEHTVVVDVGDDRVLDVVWSKSGQIIYEIDGPNQGIWAVKFDPENSQTLDEPYSVAGGCGSPSVSDQDDLLYASGDSEVEWQLVKCSRDGEIIRTYGEPDSYGLFLELSPNGQQMMTTIHDGTDRPLWLVDLERGTQRRITFGDYKYVSGSWAPDGEHYYGAGGLSFSPSAFVIQRVSVEGSAPPVPIVRGNTCDVSPDGKTIAYATSHVQPFGWSVSWSDIEKSSQLGSYGQDFEPDHILEQPGWQYSPQFSPDGKYIAYVSRENGPDEIFMQRYPEGDLKRLVSLNGGGWPRWNGAGDRLYYIEGSNMMEVEITTSPGLQIGTPKKLFTRQPDTDKVLFLDWPMPFQVSADGESFYMFYQSTPKNLKKALTIIQNWNQ